MKSNLSLLVPLLVPACMVNTPVVEGDENPVVDDSRLGEELGAWCDSFCERFVECGIEGADNCPADCVPYFVETFGGKGETCTNAGLGLMDCLEQSSCDDLDQESCDVSAAEAQCAPVTDGVVCESEDQGAGSGGASGGCSVGFSDCADGREYGLSCTVLNGLPSCQCGIDGEPQGFFQPTEPFCESGSLAIQVCGWPVVDGGRPQTPPPVECDLIGSSGDGSGVCDVSFLECTDGRSYGVRCNGAEGCRCEIDGVPIGFVGSSDMICPFASGPDIGAVAMNYSCGFRLVPPPPSP